MLGWSFTIITIILSSIILLVLKGLLANLVVTFTMPTESTLPFPLSPKVMYSLVITRVRLENHLRSSVMCREQPELINQKSSNSLACK
jgi:hypothetical protein